MSALIDKNREGFPLGYTVITQENGDDPNVLMDFGIQRMQKGDRLNEMNAKETAFILMSGRAEVKFFERSSEKIFIVERKSLFEEAPTVLHLGCNTPAEIHCLSDFAEWSVVRTSNLNSFEPKLFLPADIQSELRGKNLAQEACVRNVRLVFDQNLRKGSNLVIGEVVNFPGRWSSYPPHFHAQPEIYHYRFTLPQGYGHAELGEEVFKVRSHSTLKIKGGLEHGQVSAPGYGMYYLWLIRHLENFPYTGFEFLPEHKWILDPKNQGWEPNLL